YVDDVISAVSGNEAERLLSHLNSVEPSIQFTLEREKDRHLSFLDLNVNALDEREPATGFAVIPYIQGVTEPIKRILNSYNVKVAQKPFQTLGHIFAKPKDPVTKEQRTDAIYSIPCNDCDDEYIGQTKRQFGTRLKEHQKAVFLCKKENSALSEYTCLTNHTIGWDNSKIITTIRRYHQRLCLEAWHINSAHAPLNRDDGGLPPDAYLHLVRKKAAN
ncbi:unnamed protein product, partial [Pocillopora meandrina]